MRKHPGNLNPAVLIILLALAFPRISCALPSERIDSDDVIIRFDRPLRAVAEEVARIYPSVRGELEKIFGTEIAFTPSVILIQDRKEFQKIVGSNLVVAIAVSPDNLIIIDNSKMKTHPFTLKTTLKHELCHLLLYHYLGGNRIPRWLNEGVSQWATGGISELIMEENRDLLKQATLSGRFIPVTELVGGFPGDPRALQLAYQQSRSIVEFIVSEYEISGLLRILHKLKQGKEVQDLVKDALGLSLPELEKTWHDALRTKYTWFTYLSSYLYPLLFSFGALLLIYGFIRFIIRKRAYKDDEPDSSVDP